MLFDHFISRPRVHSWIGHLWSEWLQSESRNIVDSTTESDAHQYLLCLQDVFRGLNTRLVPSFDCQTALYIWDDLWYSTSIFLQRHKTHSISIKFLQTPCAAYAVFYGQTRGRRVHRANIYLSFPCALVACKPAKAAIQRSTADSWGGVMRSNNVLSRVP